MYNQRFQCSLNSPSNLKKSNKVMLKFNITLVYLTHARYLVKLLGLIKYKADLKGQNTASLKTMSPN